MTCREEALVGAVRRATEVMAPVLQVAETLTPGERRALQEVVRLLALFQVALGALMALGLIGGAALVLCEPPRRVGPARALLGFGMAAVAAYIVVQLPHYARVAGGG